MASLKKIAPRGKEKPEPGESAAHERGESAEFERGEMEEAREGGYGGPAGQPHIEADSEAPTGSDQRQSFVHHMDSVAYNAKHAAGHHDEVVKHATALVRLMKKMPGFGVHARKM